MRFQTPFHYFHVIGNRNVYLVKGFFHYHHCPSRSPDAVGLLSIILLGFPGLSYYLGCGLLSPFLGQIILQKTFVVILGDERHMMRITMRFAEQLLPSGAFHPAEKQQQFVAAGCS
jgi:hypothetical protein